MGAVDLVIQVESPTSVAHGLQRIGRAGHQVGEPSKGVIFPKGDFANRDYYRLARHIIQLHDATLASRT